MWLSTKACLDRVQSGTWATASAELLDEDKIRGLGPTMRRYQETWSARMEVSGFASWPKYMAGEHPHELLEFHDGERVWSVLDRQVLVQDAENPCGMMPFQIYRPTPLGKQLVGIGDLEPLEHLQRELDTLRSQRRDAATMALNAGYAFDDGAIDEEDLVFGPGAAIRVSNARPQDAIMPLVTKEVPGSGYKEEEAILRDMDAIGGVNDAAQGGPGGQINTATEATLVQSSLSARIELSSRRFEIEVVRNVARCFLYLDQRMITEHRQELVVPGQGETPEEAEQTGNWRRYPVAPETLEGEFSIEVDGGSMAAKNVPQERSDAQFILNNLAHDWYINPTKARERAMELAGIRHPQAWLRDPTPSVPMATLRYLIAANVDPSLVVQAVLHARETSAPQEGPAANQITAMQGGQK